MADWQTIRDAPMYEVNRCGDVRRQAPACGAIVGRCLDGGVSPNGYHHVTLRFGEGEQITRMRHSLVAETFLGPRPDGMEINHKDGDKSNNHVDNLEYVTPAENARHAANMGLRSMGEDHPHSRLTESQVLKIRREYAGGDASQRELADCFGVGQATIGRIVRREGWTHL